MYGHVQQLAQRQLQRQQRQHVYNHLKQYGNKQQHAHSSSSSGSEHHQQSRTSGNSGGINQQPGNCTSRSNDNSISTSIGICIPPDEGALSNELLMCNPSFTPGVLARLNR
jgi:hypothetical protein